MDRDRIVTAVRANPGLTAVLVVATVLFYFGIWRVAPYQLIPDEVNSTTQPFTIVQEPFGLTDFRKGGNLHIWLLALVYLPILVLLGAYWTGTGQLQDVLAEAERVSEYTAGGQWLEANQQLLETYQLLTTAGRFVSATAGILTVLGVALLARRLAGRTAGIVAGATLTVSMGFVLTAKFATEDVVVACFVAWTFLVLHRHYESGRDRPLLLGAALTGLAVSTKATAGLLVFVVAILAFRRYDPDDLLGWASIRELARYPTLAIAAYVATTPSLLVHPDRYVAELSRYVQQKSGETIVYAAPEPGPVAHLGHLATALGLPLLVLALLAVVGTVALTGTDRIDGFAWYLLGFAIAFFAIDASMSNVQYNRALLLVPFLALFVGIVGGWTLDVDRRPGLRRTAGAVLAVVLVLSLFYTASGVAVWSTSRADASEWTHANFDDETNVTMLTKPVYNPSVPEGTNVTRASIDPQYDRHSDARKERVLQQVRCHRTDYLLLSSFHYERYFESPSIAPNHTALYQSLLSGESGYEVAASFEPSDPNLQRDASSSVDQALSLEPPSRDTNNPRILVLKPTEPPGEGEHCEE